MNVQCFTDLIQGSDGRVGLTWLDAWHAGFFKIAFYRQVILGHVFFDTEFFDLLTHFAKLVTIFHINKFRQAELD